MPPADPWRDGPEVAAARNPATLSANLGALASQRRASVLVGGNPDAPAAWLAERDMTGDVAVLHALAGNPNTPPEALAHMAEPFPHAVLGNPVLPLLLLEHPDWLLTLPTNTILKLLACGEMAAGMVRQLTWHENDCVREAARLHTRVLGDARTDWEEQAQDMMSHKSLVYYPTYYANYLPNGVFRMPGSLPLWLLRALVHCTSRFLQLVAAVHPDAPAEWSRAVLPPDNVESARRLTHETSFDRRARDRSAKADYAVASDPTTPTEQLDTLAGSADELTRWLVAKNPHTALPTLLRLAEDPFYAIREVCMDHPHMPPARGQALCARLLMADVPLHSVFYRVLAFASPFVPPPFLERHAAAPDWLERYAIARNPQTPVRALGWLAEDGALVVRMAARAALRERLLATLSPRPREMGDGDRL